ncbi:hypothetical protein NSMM_370085 [Nitrosomonas mobilis]|uniref:Uncharacterized protein n=1 Tax=Nitrosomonas mobilis TaxID=51642 RepID=A0A1G5SDM2_9PROT|nr:hypothetical protein NSMM_370085 [Nitrosomonas mobilis]
MRALGRPKACKTGDQQDRWSIQEKHGSPTRARTWDLRINSPSLYQLSYRGIGGKQFERGAILAC